MDERDQPGAAQGFPILPEGESMGTGAIFNSAAQGATLVATVFIGAIVGRFLGPEGKGAVTALRQLHALVQDVGGLGIVRSAQFFLGKQRHPLGAAVGTYLSVFFTGVLLAMAVALVLTYLGFPPLVRMLSGADLTPRAAMLLLVPLTVVAGMYFCIRGILQALARFRAMNVPQVAVASIQLLLVLSLALLGELTVVRAILVLIGVQLLGAVLAGRELGMLLSEKIGFSLTIGGDSLRYGFPLWLVDIVGVLLVRADILIVAGALGTAELGPYSVAASLAELLWFAPQVIYVSAFRQITASPEGSGIELTKSVSHASIVITAGCSVLAALGCYPFVRLLYGTEFLTAVPLFFLLLPGYLVQGGLGQYAIYILGTLGRAGLAATVTGASLVLKLVLSWLALAVLGWGVFGVAAASSVALVAEGLAFVALARSSSGRSVRDLCVPPPDAVAKVWSSVRGLVARTLRDVADALHLRGPRGS